MAIPGMGYFLNGQFIRGQNWASDAANGVKIITSNHDLEDDGFADGLSTCICRDGQSTIIADIPWNSHKITGLGDPDPNSPGDAVNVRYVDNLGGWSTSKYISGTDLNGRLNFTGPSGVNGIGWQYADLFWGAKKAEASKTSDRLVLNSAYAANGSDVFIIDDAGRINNSGMLTNNLSYDGAAWRTIAAGTGIKVQYTGSTFMLSSNDAATTAAYGAATLRDFFKVTNSGGSAVLDLIKSPTPTTTFCGIRGYVGSELRWQMQLGSTAVESSTRKGSDFILTSYDNTGPATGPINEMVINRETHEVTFAGGVTANGHFDSSAADCIVSATGGRIYLRAGGPAVTAEQAFLDNVGALYLAGTTGSGMYAGQGLRGKAGSGGSYTVGAGGWLNFQYVAGLIHAYVDTSHMGTINITPPSDYRLKKDVQPLGSRWDAVKALRPISYTQRGGVFETFDDLPEERWGFAAHELQETLVQSAATGVKDGDIIQTPNPWTVIAALTTALQEAMLRIEALEAGAGA